MKLTLKKDNGVQFFLPSFAEPVTVYPLPVVALQRIAIKYDSLFSKEAVEQDKGELLNAVVDLAREMFKFTDIENIDEVANLLSMQDLEALMGFFTINQKEA